MKMLKNKAFTLVELLVVITILAIISVVAYQNFGGAVDKAVSGRKISDVSTIESSLQQFKVDKNYYPQVGEYSTTDNMWGYDTTSNYEAKPSNTITATYLDGSEEINTITGDGGGRVMNNEATPQQIGAKGTISQKELTKRYLTKNLSDPEINDIKVGANGKTINSGIGRYVYAVYKKPTGIDWGTDNKKGTYYNIAYTIKKEGTDSYITKIVGDYDEQSCFANSSICPKSLIGTWSSHLVDKQELGKNADGTAIAGNYGPSEDFQGIPYSVDF